MEMNGSSPRSVTSWQSHEETEQDMEDIEVALYGMLHHATPADNADFSLPLTKLSSGFVSRTSPSSEAHISTSVEPACPATNKPALSAKNAALSSKNLSFPGSANNFTFAFLEEGPSFASQEISPSAKPKLLNIEKFTSTAAKEATEAVYSVESDPEEYSVSKLKGNASKLSTLNSLEEHTLSVEKHSSFCAHYSSANLSSRDLPSKPALKQGKQRKDDNFLQEDSKYVAISQGINSRREKKSGKPPVEEIVASSSSSECELIIEDRQGTRTVETVDLIVSSEESELELIEIGTSSVLAAKGGKRKLTAESTEPRKQQKVNPLFATPAKTSTPSVPAGSHKAASKPTYRFFDNSRVIEAEDLRISENEDLVLNISMPRKTNKSATNESALTDVDKIIEDSFTDIQPINYDNFVCQKWTQAMREYYDHVGSDRDLDESYRQLPEHGWKLSREDSLSLYKPTQRNRYFRGKLLRCANCQQPDHMTRKCPDPIKPRVCHRCGEQGHTEYLCKKKMCLQCATILGAYTESCHNCLEFKFITCSICGLKGHPLALCPDTWRRYHITTKPGSIQQLPHNRSNKSLLILYCSNCSKCGHLAYQCPAYRGSPYPRYYPYIASYENSLDDDTFGEEQGPCLKDRFSKLLQESGPDFKCYCKFVFSYATDQKYLSEIQANMKKVEEEFPTVALVLQFSKTKNKCRVQLSKVKEKSRLVEFWGSVKTTCYKSYRMLRKYMKMSGKDKSPTKNNRSLPEVESADHILPKESEPKAGTSRDVTFQFGGITEEMKHKVAPEEPQEKTNPMKNLKTEKSAAEAGPSPEVSGINGSNIPEDESRVASDSDDVSVAEALPSSSKSNFDNLIAGMGPYLNSHCETFLLVKNGLTLEKLQLLKSRVEEAVGHLVVTINSLGRNKKKVVVQFWGRECWRGKNLFETWSSEQNEVQEQDAAPGKTRKITQTVQLPAIISKKEKKKKGKAIKTEGQINITGAEEHEMVQGRIQDFVGNLGPDVKASGKLSIPKSKIELKDLEQVREEVEKHVHGTAIVIRPSASKHMIEIYGQGDAGAARKLFKKLVYATPGRKLKSPRTFEQWINIQITYTGKNGINNVFSKRQKFSPQSRSEFLDKVKEVEGTYQVPVAVSNEAAKLMLNVKGKKSNQAFTHLKNMLNNS